MIKAWAEHRGGTYPPGHDQNGNMTGPILCDVDLNGDNQGDITQEYWSASCGGVPQNIYIDQGHNIYKRVCGGELNSSTIINNITNEVNAMTCE